MKRHLLAVVLFAALSLAGCDSSSSTGPNSTGTASVSDSAIIGGWSYNPISAVSQEFIFNSDHSYSEFDVINGVDISASGTWSLSGNTITVVIPSSTLTVQFTNVSVDGNTMTATTKSGSGSQLQMTMTRVLAD